MSSAGSIGDVDRPHGPPGLLDESDREWPHDPYSRSQSPSESSVRHEFGIEVRDAEYIKEYRAKEALLPEPTFRNFTLDPAQILIPPGSKKKVKTAFSFGDGNGTMAYVNEYGELLLVRRYVDLGDTGMIVAGPQVEEWRMQERLDDIMNGRHVPMGFQTYQMFGGRIVKDNPQIQYVNDRWPRVSYEVTDLYNPDVEAKIEVQMIIKDSCVIMQYILETSGEDDARLPFLLYLNLLVRPVLSWEEAWNEPYEHSRGPPTQGKGGLSACVENEPKSDKKPHIGKLQLRVAVFLDGKVLPDNAPSYTHDITVCPGQPREVTVIYGLRALDSKMPTTIPDELYYVDVCKFLQSDYLGPWGIQNSVSDSIFIYRRYLEHILSVCCIPVPPDSGRQRGVAFSDADLVEPCVLAWSSTFQFRFLLMMYRLLDASWTGSPELKESLQHRIKVAVKGNLEWFYETAETTKDTGWHTWYHASGKRYAVDDEPDREIGPGARHILKLFEFCETFPGEVNFVLERACGPVQNWLSSMEMKRDPKSKLWIHKMGKCPIQWHVPQYREDEQVLLPHFRLSYLTVVWRALQSLQDLCEGRYLLEARRVSRQGSKEELSPREEAFVGANSPPSPNTHVEEATISSSRAPTTNYAGFVRLPAESGTMFENRGTLSILPALFTVPRTSRRKSTAPANNPLRNEFESLYNAIRQSMRNLVPSEIRSRILDCFTFEQVVQADTATPGTKKVLLSMCRSARAEEPRFIFHSTDTTLYEALDWGFFSDKSLETTSPIWTETVKAQPSVERDERVWNNPLQYALALQMIARKEQEELHKEATKAGSVPGSDKSITSHLRQTLLGTTFSDGLFPDGLDIFKRPIRFHVRPNPRVRFEVACILLLLDYPQLRPKPDQRLQGTTVQVPSSMDSNDLEGNLEEVHKERRKIQKSRNRQNYTGVVDKTRLVEYTEPEWLYDDPEFFHSHTLEEELEDGNHLDEVLQEGVRMVKRENEDPSRESRPYTTTWSAKIVDVPRQPRTPVNRGFRKPPGVRDFFTVQGLDNALRRSRTKEKAKKRIINVRFPTPTDAVVLYLRSPASERNSVLGFVKRHAGSENFSLDRANKTANLWMSEIHLAFFTLLGASVAERRMTSDRSLIKRFPLKSSLGIFTDSEEPKVLVKAGLSFRMVGDMYDRYWTCWALETIPRDDSEWMYSTGLFLDRPESFHAQRRVLELRLFEKMTTQVYRSTKRIMDELDGLLKYDVEGFSGGTTHQDAFILEKTALYDKIVVLLRELDDNADAVLATAKDWNDREKARPSGDRPRWSESDEEKHGRDLNAELRNCRHAIAKLESQKAKLKGRIEQVTKLGDTVRSDLNLRVAILQARSAEDVRLFTYATVLFLPLSFSSSIFSMGGSPAHDTAMAFIKAAVIALVVTAFILLNVKLLDKGYKKTKKGAIKARHFMSTTTQDKMRDSDEDFWVKKGKALAARAEMRKAQFLRNPDNQQKPTSIAWYFWFWIRQCLWRYPAHWLANALESAYIAGNRGRKRPPYVRLWNILLGLVIFPFFAFIYSVLFILLNVKDTTMFFAAMFSKAKSPPQQPEVPGDNGSPGPKLEGVSGHETGTSEKRPEPEKKVSQVTTVEQTQKRKSTSTVSSHQQRQHVELVHKLSKPARLWTREPEHDNGRDPPPEGYWTPPRGGVRVSPQPSLHPSTSIHRAPYSHSRRSSSQERPSSRRSPRFDMSPPDSPPPGSRARRSTDSTRGQQGSGAGSITPASAHDSFEVEVRPARGSRQKEDPAEASRPAEEARSTVSDTAPRRTRRFFRFSRNRGSGSRKEAVGQEGGEALV